MIMEEKSQKAGDSENVIVYFKQSERGRADGVDSIVSKPNYRNAKCRGRGMLSNTARWGKASSASHYLFSSGPQRAARCSPILEKAICFLESIHLNANLSWKYSHRHTQEYYLIRWLGILQLS